MRARQQHLRTVLDTGPLTIDEVRTARGTPAFIFTARNKKYGTIHTLREIRDAIDGLL